MNVGTISRLVRQRRAHAAQALSHHVVTSAPTPPPKPKRSTNEPCGMRQLGGSPILWLIFGLLGMAKRRYIINENKKDSLQSTFNRLFMAPWQLGFSLLIFESRDIQPFNDGGLICGHLTGGNQIIRHHSNRFRPIRHHRQRDHYDRNDRRQQPSLIFHHPYHQDT